MATITFEAYIGTTKAWTDISTDTLVFSGSLTAHDVAITVDSYQDGTHLGTGDPGTHNANCVNGHANNIKYLTSNTMSLNGAGSANVSTLVNNDATVRLHFNHSSAVAVTNARAYVYKFSVGTTTKADNANVYGIEISAADAAWTLINDTTTTGGDNSGERLDLENSASATDHYWYIGISVSPAVVGDHSDIDLGMALTYS